jgi:hypothetical protein
VRGGKGAAPHIPLLALERIDRADLRTNPTPRAVGARGARAQGGGSARQAARGAARRGAARLEGTLGARGARGSEELRRQARAHLLHLVGTR